MHVYESGKDQHPCFGELSLIYGKPRAASVIALQSGVLWGLDRKVFQRVVVRVTSSRKETFAALRKIEILKSLSIPQFQRLNDLLKEAKYSPGDYIIKQGEIGETFCILVKGSCDCTVF